MRPQPAQDSPSWYVPFPDELMWASWGGDAYVAYHRPSGKTHFLNAASYVLLSELLREPLDVDAVARQMALPEGGDEAASARNREQFEALLNYLEQIGLVRRA